MSFFAIEPRQLSSSTKHPINTGPGCYQDKLQDKANNRQGYAPFGSLQKKKQKHKSGNQLGPGQYQIRSQICKPSITKYENSNCIIIKINEQGWSQFKSQTNRFKPRQSQKQTVPGPGEYQPQRQRARSESKPKQKSSIGQRIKQMNLKNYNQRRKPTLFSDIKSAVSKEITKKQTLKGASWSLNKKQRFEPLQKQTFHEEYKEQVIDKLKQEKNKARSKSQSAVFASKSLKSNLQAQIYQSSNPFKVQLRKMIKYKDDRPGPGTYNCQELQAKKRQQFNRHQFFGSTVQRFRGPLNTEIGPGYYSPKFQSQKKVSPNKNNNLQQVQLNRHSYISYNIQIPGPGSYSVDGKKKHSTSCKWVFGSKQPRFSQKTTIEQNQEQIEEFQLERKIKKQREFDYRKQFLNNKSQANFASTTKRFEKTQNHVNIPVGNYDVSHTDIAQKIKKAIKKDKQTGRFNRNAQTHPFMSSVDRFRTQGCDQEENVHNDCWCLVKSVQKQMYPHQSSAFTSKQKRTVVFQNANTRYTPAVGTYTKQSSFVKSSFNSRFIKSNQSRVKKLKIWNSQRNKIAENRCDFIADTQSINLIKVN